MSNNNNTSSTRTNSGADTNSQSKNTSSAQASRALSTTSSDGEPTGNQLEQLVDFLKENWRPVMAELVAAGVTAYLVHDAKIKSARKN